MAPSTQEDFILCAATQEDVTDMVAVYLSAFARDPWARLNWKACSHTTLRKWLAQRFTTMFRTPGIFQFVVKERSTGRVVGFVRWGFPVILTKEQKEQRERSNEKQEEERRNGVSLYPEGANIESCDAMFGAIAKYQKKWFKADDMYIVHFLAVHEAYQGKGIGKMLLRYGLDLADADGKQAYLEASEAGHPVYSKLGFRDVDLSSVDLTKWAGSAREAKNWIMIRDPQSSDVLQKDDQ